MRVIIFGATRGCGLETLLVLLNQGGPQMEVHVMVRNKEAFSTHLQTQSLDAAKLKQLHIFVGDALIPEQVQSFIQGVAKSGQIDAVISSLGVAPDFKITQPFNVMPAGSENLCRDSMVNILAALEEIAPMQQDKKVPRLIVVSSNGMDKPSHNALPWLLRPVYAMIKQPHLDKIYMEKLLHQKYNIFSQSFNPTAKSQVDSIYSSEKLTILRPALLTDGKAKSQLRSSESILPSAWSVSRKDVGLYIAGNCLSVGSDKVKETKTKDESTSFRGGIVLAY